MADVSMQISGDEPAREREAAFAQERSEAERGRIAPLARQLDGGVEGPMNITPYSIPMHASPKAPESYDGHPIEHAARHAKGRTPPVR